MLVLVKNGSVPISLIIRRVKTSGMTSHYWLLIRQCFTSHFLLLPPLTRPSASSKLKLLDNVLTEFYPNIFVLEEGIVNGHFHVIT